MKNLSIKIDDFLFHLVEEEAEKKSLTKIEIIRAAIMNYFMHREDMQDIQLAESRLQEDDLPFDRHF